MQMECAQINIVGGTGTSVPAKTYSIPGIYKANDPGILVNIYSMTTSSKYVIPGPPLFTCGGAGAVPASEGGSESPAAEVPAAPAAEEAAPVTEPSWYAIF